MADLSDMTAEEQNDALRHYMRLNNRILHGRFCGDLIVNYELAVPIEDGEFTATQLERCFHLTVQVTRREKYKPDANSTSETETEDTDFECEPFCSDGDGESEDDKLSDSESNNAPPSEGQPTEDELGKGEQGAA